jgi:hypothetical protein
VHQQQSLFYKQGVFAATSVVSSFSRCHIG